MAMCFILWLIIVIVAGLVASWLVDCVADYSDEWSGKKVLFTTVAIMIFLAACFSPLFYEFPNWGLSTLVTVENGEVVEHPWGCWEKLSGDGQWRKFARLSFPSDESGHGRADTSLMIVLPKGAKKVLDIGVVAMITDREKYLSDPDRWPGLGDLERWKLDKPVENLLLEFVLESGQEKLGKFNNPSDDNLQQQFKQEVEKWMDGRMKECGVTIRAKPFSLR